MAYGLYMSAAFVEISIFALVLIYVLIKLTIAEASIKIPIKWQEK